MSEKKCDECDVGCEHLQYEGDILYRETDCDADYLRRASFTRFAFCPMCGRDLAAFWGDMGLLPRLIGE